MDGHFIFVLDVLLLDFETVPRSRSRFFVFSFYSVRKNLLIKFFFFYFSNFFQPFIIQRFNSDTTLYGGFQLHDGVKKQQQYWYINEKVSYPCNIRKSRLCLLSVFKIGQMIILKRLECICSLVSLELSLSYLENRK